jgi:hypothetical protein
LARALCDGLLGDSASPLVQVIATAYQISRWQ